MRQSLSTWQEANHAPTAGDKPDTARLRHRSALAGWACRAAALAIPMAVLASWITGTATAAALARLGLPPDYALMAMQLGSAALVSLLPALALGRSLFAAARCFDGFARGDWFGKDQARAMATSGRWLIMAGALGLAVPTILGLVLSFNATSAARVLVISLCSQGVLAILFGALIWTLASPIAAENARVV